MVAWWGGGQEGGGGGGGGGGGDIKLGPNKEEFGPLNSRTTNQRFYKVNGKELEDITSKFWKHETEN